MNCVAKLSFVEIRLSNPLANCCGTIFGFCVELSKEDAHLGILHLSLFLWPLEETYNHNHFWGSLPKFPAELKRISEMSYPAIVELNLESTSRFRKKQIYVRV